MGTAVQGVAFGSLVLAVVASLIDEPTVSPGPSYALGFILVPVTAAAVAFISAHDNPPMATLKGMGAWLVVGLPLAVLNPIIGFSTAFAAAGAFTLRSDAPRPGRARAIAVAVLAVYVTVLVGILPQAAVFAGAVTPLLAVRAADLYLERSAAR